MMADESATGTGEEGASGNAARQETAPRGTSRDQSRLADEMSEQSFPTSDPPSTWAGPDPGSPTSEDG
jgi:hypothetical protein